LDATTEKPFLRHIPSSSQSLKELGAWIYCLHRNAIWPLQGSSSWILLNFGLLANIFAFTQRQDDAANFIGVVLFYLHSKSWLPALLTFLIRKESERLILWCKGKLRGVSTLPAIDARSIQSLCSKDLLLLRTLSCSNSFHAQHELQAWKKRLQQSLQQSPQSSLPCSTAPADPPKASTPLLRFSA